MSYSTAQQRIEVKTEMRMKLNVSQFGELEYNDTIVYHFASGLPGFEEFRKFIGIQYGKVESS